MVALLTVVLSSLLLAASAFASETDTLGLGGPRIRPQDERLGSLLAAGAARSGTLRALVDRVEASNVFVYVSLSPLLKSTMAGRVTWMTRSGDYRYLRVTISTDLSADQTIAALGHELHHVLEVVENPNVIDERSLSALYQRIGRPSRVTSNTGWETAAAQEIGYRVRRELVGMRSAAALRTTDGDKL